MNFKNLKSGFLALLFVFSCAASAHADSTANATAKAIPPSPRSYVFDETGKLSSSERQALFNRLSREDISNGNQIVVAFFNSIDNEDLVDYTNRVFKTWNPGSKGKNNGILLAAYLKEHQLRIEVGYGLEPYVTDAKSKEVILNDLTPAFKAGNFDGGVDLAVSHLIQIIHKGEGISDQETEGQAVPNLAPQAPDTNVGANLIFILVFAFLILRPLLGMLLAFFFPSLRAWFLFSLLFGFGSSGSSGGGFFGGGGFGGGGFGGGGGFSGGGGMSGGGGASGSW